MGNAPHASQAEQLFSEGRAGEALRALDPVRRDPARAPADTQVLLAEVLVATGYEDEAWALATRLGETPGLAKSLKARCACVVGRVLSHRARPDEAVRVYQTAATLASQAGDAKQHARAQLAIFGIASDLWSPAATEALGKEVRRSVLRLGDPDLLAELHIELARHEGMHGNVDAAIRHVRAARSLLQTRPHHLRQTRLHSVESAVWEVASFPHAAIEAARAALSSARLASSRFFEGVALGNLAHTLLRRGNLSLSREYANHLLGMPPCSLDNELATLETLARRHLLEGELRECETLCEQIERVCPRSDAGIATWREIDVCLLRADLARHRGDWARAKDLAAKGEELAELRQDRLHASVFRALKLEAAVRSGDAAVAPVFLLDPPADLPLETMAEILRARGSAFVALGLPALAAPALERALVIDHVLEAAPARAEVIRHYRELVHQVSGRDIAKAQADVAGPPGPLRRAAVRSQALTGPDLPALAEVARAPHLAFDHVAALFDYAAHPDILGHELLLLLAEQGVARALALVRRPGDGNVDVVARAGWDEPTARRRAHSSEGVSVLALGESRGASYELLVEPDDDLGSRLVLAAVRKLLDAAQALQASRRAERERTSLWPPEAFEDGASEVFVASEMIDLVKVARRVAETTLPVLLTGETGTGKEVIARLIHRASPRAAHPFLACNCTALPRDLLESQLFGHRRGAFTGAHETFAGLVRSAAGGTLFLDEIGELAPDLQPKLLRFLETNEVHPIGEARPVKVDVRVIAATNADLEQLMEQRRFREDLFYRLSVVRLRVPPLRERREEIPALVDHFLRRTAQEFHKGRPTVTDETLEYFLLYAWPGNIRELANELRRIVSLLEPDGVVTPAHLAPHILAARRTVPAHAPQAGEPFPVRLDQPLPKVLEAVERLMIGRALEATGGHLERAARLLGISRKGLFLKRRRWGLGPAGRPGRAPRPAARRPAGLSAEPPGRR
jgi:DNA-binding NtrC family response regulator/tetratricopeptide (TPR) repeat protein